MILIIFKVNQVWTVEIQFRTFEEYRDKGSKTKTNLVLDDVNNKTKKDKKNNQETRWWRKRVRAKSFM